MAYITNYEPWEHGHANTAPVGDEEGNIIGLELEIGKLYDADLLESFIDEGLIETADSRHAPIQLEREAQGNVQYELIFNADTPANVLGRLEEIIEIRHDVNCHHETSCHVHLNRAYLNKLGLGQLDIYRAAEAVAPLIYHVSGRDMSCWERWSPSRVPVSCNPSAEDIIARFAEIDDAEPYDRGYYDDRYELCNVQNGSTVEIRGFSNFFEFDFDLIAFYIAIADTLLPRIALEMKDKTYADDWERVLKVTADFLKGFEAVVNRFSLDLWTDPAALVRDNRRRSYHKAINIFEGVDNRLQTARSLDSALDAAEVIIETLRRFDFLEATIINLEDIAALIDDLDDQNQRHFKNSVWRS